MLLSSNTKRGSDSLPPSRRSIDSRRARWRRAQTPLIETLLSPVKSDAPVLVREPVGLDTRHVSEHEPQLLWPPAADDGDVGRAVPMPSPGRWRGPIGGK
jgi:hypothetical protein